MSLRPALPMKQVLGLSELLHRETLSQKGKLGWEVKKREQGGREEGGAGNG